MAVATTLHRVQEVLEIRREPKGVTLLELVQAIGDATDDEREVVATAIWMLTHGRVKLRGSFCDEPVSQIELDALRDELPSK